MERISPEEAYLAQLGEFMPESAQEQLRFDAVAEIMARYALGQAVEIEE